MKRRRVETVANLLPCLTTSSQLWSEEKGRLSLGREQLGALGYPCVGVNAASSKVDMVDLSSFTEGLSSEDVRKWHVIAMRRIRAFDDSAVY